MMAINTNLPTDIHSLLKTGIDSLDDIHWPVTDEEYFGLMQAYRDAFQEVVLSLDSSFKVVLIADFSFIGFLGQASHAMAVVGRARETGGNLDVGPLARSFYNPDWHALGRIKPHDSGGHRIGLMLKGFAKNIKFNSHLGLLARIASGNRSALGIGSFSRLKGEYARERETYVRNIYLRNLLPFEKINNNPPPKALASAAEGILARLEEVFADRFGFELGLVTDAASCWKRRLGRLAAVCEDIKSSRNLPKEVLVSETARPFHKAIAAGFRRRVGGRAVGFHHGNSMGGRPSAMNCYSELVAYDTFVVPTRACADAYREQYSSCAIGRQSRLEVVSTDTNYYKLLYKALAKKSLPKRIKTVMLMGFPMNANRYYGVPGNFFLFQLDLEIRLAGVLRKNGYKVLYKIHPERQDGTWEVMDPLCDEIVPDAFEQCWEKADALLVKYTASSTFGFALCTNRPIILLDHERSSWRPDHYEALTRRCWTVPAWIQETRIGFDEGALLEALERKPEPPDTNYITHFMWE